MREIQEQLKTTLEATVSLFIFLMMMHTTLSAQNNYVITHDDSLALEKVIVEKYYVSEESDYSDTLLSPLPKGSITYRIFIDMKAGYNLQMVYGNPKHELLLETTTRFYNDKMADAFTGFNINVKHINKGNIALDSWITMGAAARGFTGIPRIEDTTGFSIITNRPSLKLADGLCKGVLPDFKQFNLDLNFFNNDSNATRFSTNNGGWAALGGVKGPTAENRVLIAQLTTNGKLTFKLNVQIGTPTGGYVKFVASNPEASEIQFDGLTQK
ncbi:MAG: hypothetical protein WCH34_18030 [Bacteroidota bacterium]